MLVHKIPNNLFFPDTVTKKLSANHNNKINFEFKICINQSPYDFFCSFKHIFFLKYPDGISHLTYK